MHEHLVRLRANAPAEFERVLAALEKRGGRVLHAYPPAVVVVVIAPSGASEVAKLAAVASISTGPVSARDLAAAGDEERTALQVWNDHLSRARQAPRDATIGLSWDAPGRLPPDPPADIREELRRREERLDRGE